MMAKQGTTERELLSCSICLDLPKNPKTLPCMHRICERCLNGHIVTSTAGTLHSVPGFKCPVCTEFIAAPSSSSDPSTWTGLVKTDCIFASIIEFYESRQKFTVPKVSHPCPKHENKEQELYCRDCSATVCHLCAVISHRGCHTILTVTEAAQQRRNTWQACIQQIPSLINEVLGIEKLRESNMIQLNNTKSRIENEIKETAKKMHNAVIEEEKILLNQVQVNYNEPQQNSLKLTEQINKLKTFKQKVSSKLSSSSNFDLMIEKEVSNTVDSFIEQNQTINKDYHRLCEALSSVKWNFIPQYSSHGNLGYIECIYDTSSQSKKKYPVETWNDKRSRRGRIGPLIRKSRIYSDDS